MVSHGVSDCKTLLQGFMCYLTVRYTDSMPLYWGRVGMPWWGVFHRLIAQGLGMGLQYVLEEDERMLFTERVADCLCKRLRGRLMGLVVLVFSV